MRRPFIALMLTAALLAGCGGQLAPPAGSATPGTSAAASAQAPTATPFVSPTAMPTATPTPAPLGYAPVGTTETATVLRVIDGDTIEVDRGNGPEKVRYIGVDTPETVAPDSPVQWMGPEASAANKRLVEGREVLLERDVSETDKYDRLLRYVWVEDASAAAGWLLVNLALVSQGYAQVSTYPPDVQYVDLYLEAQRAAEAAGLGLWGPEPTAKPTAKPKPTNCHPSYEPCLPIVGDLDCPDVRAMGKAPVRVIGPDDYRLDRDKDGWGCE